MIAEMLSFGILNEKLSILTLEGRQELPFQMGANARATWLHRPVYKYLQ